MLPILRNNAALRPMAGGPINRLDSIFDHVFGEDGPVGQVWGVVPLAMWEDDDRVYVEAELPGMTERDVEVTVHDGTLFIRGERKPEDGRRYLYDGRAHGRFERAITLPGPVDADGAEASLRDGMLSVSLPKSPEAKPKKIAIMAS